MRILRKPIAQKDGHSYYNHDQKYDINGQITLKIL